MSDLTLRPIGVIRSDLKSKVGAPKQGHEGAPDAWIDVEPWAADGLLRMAPGTELVVLTWLHQSDRTVLQNHPRSDGPPTVRDPPRQLTAEQSIRSQFRINWCRDLTR